MDFKRTAAVKANEDTNVGKSSLHTTKTNEDVTLPGMPSKRHVIRNACRMLHNTHTVRNIPLWSDNESFSIFKDIK